MRGCVAIVGLFLLVDLVAEVPVTGTVVAEHAVTKVRIVRGQLDLPSEGGWWARDPFVVQSNAVEFYMKPVDESRPGWRGERRERQSDEQVISYRRSALENLYQGVRRYALENAGLAPEELATLIEDKGARGRYLHSRDAAKGFHLLGGKRIYDRPNDASSLVDEASLLAFDTTPAIEDGKHWVIDTRGKAERVAVDDALLEKHGLTLKPSGKSAAERKRVHEQPLRAYHIYARLKGEPGDVVLGLSNVMTGGEERVRWQMTDPEQGDVSVVKEWADLRGRYLETIGQEESLLSSAWRRTLQRQYELNRPYSQSMGRGRRPEQAHAMGVLGGRAAIRETLQMQNLELSNQAIVDEPTPIAEIPGVEVVSHPFEKMLEEEGGGTAPALLDWVPEDRFMVYFPEPKGLFPLLEGGAAFLHESGSSLVERKVAYRLKERYLERLGLSEDLMRQFLETGVITEMALLLPDLFLIDGTELTMVARTSSPVLTKAALALLGVSISGESTVKQNAEGEAIVWTLKEDILILSTSERETGHALQAHADGKGLGQTAEFRYMLGKMPMREETRVYTYFSDAFIRRLVGPQVKIGQVRRLLARSELEQITAGAMLASFDGLADLEVSELVERDYVEKPRYATDVRIDPTVGAVSERFGSSKKPASMESNVVIEATPQEKAAYERYLANYSRFWRRFFDPIAMRYDVMENEEHELHTFILPLIDNSLYNGLKTLLLAGDQSALKVPQLDPEPVAMLSVNLQENAWLEAVDSYGSMLEDYLGLDGQLLDLIGPDLHVAFHDADPVISLGSGELQGLFGQFSGRMNVGMAIWSPLIPLLTRPTSFLIGLDDPEAVKVQLNQMAFSRRGSGAGGFAKSEFYRVRGEDRWIFKVSMMELISLRFGIEIKDRYLVVNNLPFSESYEVTPGSESANGAAKLTLSPNACLEQLPALFASAVERDRMAALSSSAALAPLMMSGQASSAAEAQAQHFKAFGFEPQHPNGGIWEWEHGHLVSSLYGLPWRQEQPAFDPKNKEVGALRRVSQLRVSMQFEEDGLRSTARWSLK